MTPDRFDERRDDAALDREILALLAVDPSPQFHALVRRRIANASPASVHRWLPWWLGAAAAVAALVMLAVMAAVLAPVRRAAPVSAVAARRFAAFAPPIARRMPGLAAESASASSRALSSRSLPPKHEPARTSEPDIVLAPDETRALRALVAGVRDGRIDLTPLTREPSPDVMDPEPIRDLVIAPIVIAPVEGERQ